MLTALAGFAFSSPAIAQIVDADGDGLIEIDSLDKLNNIRYSLDGTSYKTTSDSTATGDTGGCPGDVCKGYELVKDLDFDINGNGEADAGDAYYRDGEGWEPIPNGGSFSAIFEGNQHTISNLFIDERVSNDEISIGLFSNVFRGEIRNLGLVNADVTGNGQDTGALVGRLDFGETTVTASYALATVSGADGLVGGLVGWNGGGTITASYALATVSGTGNVGGLVGQNDGTITASYALATVSGGGSVGGLVGWNVMTITASYALATVSGTGNVDGIADFIGGLVGQNDGTIRASYAAATVSGTEDDQVGGLVGGNDGTITASYALATVSGAEGQVGGLVGFEFEDSTASYFDATVSGLTEPSDQARSTEALQMPTEAEGYSGIYANWDVDIGDTMDNPWHLGTSTQYPGLSLPQQGRDADQGCPTTLGSFTSTLPRPQKIEVTLEGGRCVHRPVDAALRLKLRIFLESALP